MSLSGNWKPTQLQALYYGEGAVLANLINSLPSSTSKAFIITTSSLKNSRALHSVESSLGARHAGTFSSIGAHVPAKDLDAAINAIKSSPVDTLISIGGGSPIDSTKAITHRLHDQTGQWLYHITIPTTLSAAECTFSAGYTNESGVKTGIADIHLPPQVIIYDASFVAGSTPQKLWLSTGLRALDHAVETWYRSDTPTTPTRPLVLVAIKDLFEYLPQSKKSPDDAEIITKLQLAAFNSLWPYGVGMKGGLGLSHSLGYALGSPYGIPHGITSCLTLGKVVKLRAEDAEQAKLLAQLTSVVGLGQQSGDDRADAMRVGEAIEDLVRGLGLETDLGEYKVPKRELEVIVERATAGNQALAGRVRGLVKSLWKDSEGL